MSQIDLVVPDRMGPSKARNLKTWFELNPNPAYRIDSRGFVISIDTYFCKTFVIGSHRTTTEVPFEAALDGAKAAIRHFLSHEFSKAAWNRLDHHIGSAAKYAWSEARGNIDNDDILIAYTRTPWSSPIIEAFSNRLDISPRGWIENAPSIVRLGTSGRDVYIKPFGSTYTPSQDDPITIIRRINAGRALCNGEMPLILETDQKPR